MELSNMLEFRKDLYFEGAVQADWFYNPEKASKVAENFVFHGSQYFGIEDQGIGSKKRIDTISLVEELATKLKDERANALSLAIADYGTGKSHLAVTLAQIFSGPEYMPETYNKVLSNILNIDKEAAKKIKSLCEDRNFVMVINGMRDFNLHAEILKAAQKSLRLYGLSDDSLRKLNRALETAEMFFNRNAESSISLFEKVANEKGWSVKGKELLDKIRNNLMVDEEAFEIVNGVYFEINGQDIKWDEGISASNILEMLISEYCGMNGRFDHIIILFDEFGRYLEYASGVNAAKSGDSALQQIFETSQNAEGTLQVINFIQSDIKTYLQRVDQTKNISRYIGRYDASDKYYISSNLETVFANLIQRIDKQAFDNLIVKWQNSNEAKWKDIYNKLNKWIISKGMWKDYGLFRKVVVEGIYPMHPLATFMLTQLSDYLQNRSSLTLISQYIESVSHIDIDGNPVIIMPEHLMQGDLYTEMLAAEQEGKQPSQQCIRFDNIMRRFGDKLSEQSLVVLRSNLILRILRFRTTDYADVKDALSLCSGLSIPEIEEELRWLENEYAVLGFDDHAGCFDFMEESNGAHDFKVIKKRLMVSTKIDKLILASIKIQEIAGVLEPQTTNFGIQHKISTSEWLFKQELYAIEDFTEARANTYLAEWKSATSSITAKGRLVWLYVNKDTDRQYVEKANQLVSGFEGTSVVIMILNDEENRLFDCLLEYSVLDNMDDLNRKKYERHYLDDFKQAESNLKDEFDELKKKRLLLEKDNVRVLTTRMPAFLTSVFEEIYTEAVSFWFDGLVTKGNNLGGKGGTYYCTIVKMLLSNSVNDDTIHNFSSDIRNRIEAILMTSTSTSWKCINEQYRMIPPEDKKAKAVYDKIVADINTNKELFCKGIFDTYCKPPYGMSEDAVTLMIAVICANLSYCLRFRYKGELTNINNWKELVVIKDKKIDIDVVRASSFVLVDAGEVIGKYMRFFERIQNNRKISEVTHLANQLELMITVDEIPEELETSYLLVKKILESGKKARNEWSVAIGGVEEKFEDAQESNDLYNALVALEMLSNIPTSRIFGDNGFDFDDESKKTIANLITVISAFVSKTIDYYISNMYCRSVEAVNTFRNHNTKIQTKLEELGFADYSRRVQVQKDKELNNIEEIRSRQELKDDYLKYILESKIDKFTSYMNICSTLKNGKELQERVEKYKVALGKDAANIVSTLNTRIEELSRAKDRITKDMSDIWDDLFEVKSADDVEDLLERIGLVLQKGISSKDQLGFVELQGNLQKLLEDINKVKASTESRKEFVEVSEQVKDKYQKSEFDFDVLPILEEVICDISKDLDRKENLWRLENLSLGDKTRTSVHKWKEKTKYLPEYLSDETMKEVQNIITEADVIISEGKIEDVVFYFEKLDGSEKKKCIDLLREKLNSYERKPNC